MVIAERRAAAVKRLDALAFLMDDWIPVPGLGVRFGLDPLIGLVPGLGDAVGALLSGYIVLESARLGAGFAVIARMLLNLAIDGIVGSVPIVGDLFDAGFKANDRNLRLLHRVVDSPEGARKASAAFLGAVLVLLLALFAGTVAVIWIVLAAIFHLGAVRLGV